MRTFVIGLALLATACNQQTPAEQEAERQAAVAEVEAHQTPPPEELTPDTISFAMIETNDLFGAGCAFFPEGGSANPVALMQSERGYMVRKGELLTFASDSGSRELPYAAHEKYSGRDYGMMVSIDETAGKQTGSETIRYPGTLTVRDGYDNTVFAAKGAVECGA